MGNRKRQADRLARKFLGEARQAIGSKEEFYEALHRALHNYLKAKINLETSEFSKEKINELLLERKVADDTIVGFIQLLQSCEIARFTPSTRETMEEDYEKASRVISSIDKQIRR